MSGPRIVVVGSMNIDLAVFTSRIPGPGETIIGERFVMGFGGKGANQAVMASLLGARVAMAGCLGDDQYRALTLANFDSHGIDSSRVGVVSGSSGVAVIWVEPGGTNRIIVVPGANQAVLPEAAAAAVEAFSDASVVIGQLEVPQQSTAAAFEAARRSGAVTVLNPAPAASLEPELLKASDWIILNEVELSMLGGSVGLDSLRLPVSLGRKRLVVTLGDRGAVLLSDGGEIWVDAEKVAAVDTTGAGDAFVGAFAYGLAAGLTEVEAVRLGCACATESVTRPGTQASFKAMPVPPRPRPGWQSQPT